MLPLVNHPSTARNPWAIAVIRCPVLVRQADDTLSITCVPT